MIPKGSEPVGTSGELFGLFAPGLMLQLIQYDLVGLIISI